jgi:hypothetical protein
VIGVLIVLAALCLLGYLWDTGNHGEGVIIGATIGTALGTLALAGTTYGLARATRQTVREAGAELEELKAQGKLVSEQARIAGQQAEATARLADSSRAAAQAAEKARIDAISPLVQCRVTLDNIEVVNRDRQRVQYSGEMTWSRAQLADLRFTVTLGFHLKNVGHGPARVTFGDTSTRLETVLRDTIDFTELGPEGTFSDQYKVHFTGDEITAGELVKMPFTYSGIMQGEMFDRIQWNGWVTPLFEQTPGDPIVQHPRLINSSGAQVLRDYPVLEYPEETAKAQAALVA